MQTVLMRLGAILVLFVCCHAAQAGGLSGVRSWLLLLNNDLDDAMVSRIAQSGYDMVVIDDVSTQSGVPVGRSKDIVARLRKKPDGTQRQVIAYLNVGQAEDYRTYWRKGWRAGSPRFILGDDPEGWAGNFPVAYWKPAWKKRIVGDSGLLARIKDAGFDGVYLDWIGGYENDQVIAAARRDHVDPGREMISWVKEVSAAGKAGSPSFQVIAQNAAGLLADPAYIAAIDAVAHEDIWFTGADGGPEGDCPVPKSLADVGSAAFMASLDHACRSAFRRNSSGAMHSAGYAEVVPMLKLAAAQGLTVFTVDYARQIENVQRVLRESRNLGFVPFVGGRRLDAFVDDAMTIK